MFRSAGYRVDGIGQWGLGGGGTSGEPKAKGFNQWIGFLEQVDAHDYYPELIWRYDSVSDWNGLRQNPGRQYIQDLFNSAMGRSVEINSDFQFFLYLPFTLLHANPRLKERGMQVPHDAPYTAEKWPQPEKNKAAMIARLDQSVGQLLARLEQHKLQRDTIVIFTSDNGPHNQGGVDPKFFKSSGPFRGLKGDLYEGGIRVPMIVWWPGRVDAGKVSEQVGAMWDVLPTLNEAIGQPALEGVDGLSMLPTWFGEKQTNQHENLYWETHEQGFHQAIRRGDWKALRLKPAEGLELYDLKTDPGEAKDMAAQHPEIVARIEEIMRASRTESNEWPSVQPLQPTTGVAVEKRREPVTVPPPKSPSRGN